jgi:hypothetical protein
MPGTGVSAGRRAARLLRARSPRLLARAARREVVWRRQEGALARAIRRGRPLLVGPFLGEVGFELLYWLPVVRRILAEHAVDPDRVTVLSRGGAGVWYSDVAAHSLDVLDLLPPERFLEELVARRRRAREAKQFFPDRFDRLLARLARERVGDAVQLHPLVMYSRMRFVLEGLEPPEQATRIGDYRPLPAPDRGLPSGCPSEYVAVKLYFTDPFPDTPRSRRLATEALERLAAEGDVVLLTSGAQLDEHREWLPAGERIYDSSAWVSPRDNLAVQTTLAAHARALVCPYGGFSYLGGMLGVPTLALQTAEPYSPVHLAVFRAAYPQADYRLAGEADAVGTLASRLAEARR